MYRERQKVRAAFFDVDGVLKDYSPQGLAQRFEEEAIEGLSRLNESGIIIGYASGKCCDYLFECASLSGTLYDNSIIIGENGGIISLNGSKIVYDRYMEDLYKARKQLERYKNSNNIYEIPSKKGVCNIREEDKESMITLLFDPREKEIVERFLYENLDCFPNLHILFGSCYVDINQKGCNKGYAVQKACELLGLPLSDVAAVGDGNNDIPMLDLVKHPACPSNSKENIKELVRKRNGYVASYPIGKGTKEICLEYLLR
ncbi:MAG: HAD family hydrolase [Candidatus Pacearchaeota archaeon]